MDAILQVRTLYGFHGLSVSLSKSTHGQHAMKPWRQVQKDLKVTPIVEGAIGGATPLYVERYLYKSIAKSVSGLSCVGLVTMFGGSRVREGDTGQSHSNVMASQSMLIPSNYSTHWQYSGTVDFAVFYFPDRMAGIQDRLRLLAESRRAPILFGDALVGATALQIVNELHKGTGADEGFMEMLAPVMLEQTYRVLTTPATGESIRATFTSFACRRCWDTCTSTWRPIFRRRCWPIRRKSASPIFDACFRRRWERPRIAMCSRRGWSRRASCSR